MRFSFTTYFISNRSFPDLHTPLCSIKFHGLYSLEWKLYNFSCNPRRFSLQLFLSRNNQRSYNSQDQNRYDIAETMKLLGGENNQVCANSRFESFKVWEPMGSHSCGIRAQERNRSGFYGHSRIIEDGWVGNSNRVRSECIILFPSWGCWRINFPYCLDSFNSQGLCHSDFSLSLFDWVFLGK